MKKVVKKSLRVVALFMILGVVAPVQAMRNVFAADETVAVTPEVVVSGSTDKRKSYKPETVSSPKYSRALVDTPQTVAVIPQAVIQDQNATTLRETLKNVPGISMQAGEGGTPAGDQLSIRGFSARTDLFIDNIRDLGGYTRDPFAFEQVEVVKGPASSYTGRGSTGGSINLVSKTPKLDNFYRATAGIGTDEYKRTTVDVNQSIPDAGGIEGIAVRFNGLIHHDDVPGRKVADNERWGIAPSVAFGLGTDTRLTASYLLLRQDNRPDYGIPWVPANNNALPEHREYPAPVDGSNYYGLSARDYEYIHADIVTVKFEHDFNDALTLRDQFRYGRVSRDSIITAPRFANANSTDITRTDWKSRDQVDSILANQLDLISNFETFGLGHDLVTGIEIARETETNRERIALGPDSQDTSLFSPNPSDRYLENIQATPGKDDARANSVALYGFDTIAITDWLDINGGLRYDFFETNFNDVGGQPFQRTDNLLSWNSGIVYKPVDTGSIYFGYGTAYNPSAEGLTLSSGMTSRTNPVSNSVTAEPEKTRTFELGTKWELLKRKLLLNAAGFWTTKTNARTLDPADPSRLTVLDGEQRVFGFELGASGNITDEWQLFAAYTYLNSKITQTRNLSERGNELSNTPDHSFNVWTTYLLPWNFEIGAGLNYVDTRFSSNANTRKAPHYILFDAMIAYHATENITLRLNFYNLTDQEYIGSVGGGHFIPGPTRQAVLSTSFEF